MKLIRLQLALASATLISAGPLLAGYGGSGSHPDPHCHGDIYHDAHNWSSASCPDTYNPHFALLGGAFGVCDEASSGVNNCDGCYGCCNGMLDQHVECICASKTVGRATCEASASRNAQNCQGNCVAAFEGDGCNNPNMRLD